MQETHPPEFETKKSSWHILDLARKKRKRTRQHGRHPFHTKIQLTNAANCHLSGV